MTTMDERTGEMVLRLSPAEHRVLSELLSNALGNLREEVYKTENYDWRQDLKQRELLLKDLLGRLGVPTAAPGGDAHG